MANPRIIPKKSAISKVPSSSDLVSGEVAVNYADQQWYGKHPSTGAIVEIGAPYLHSHDQLLSLDKNNELELTNVGSLVLSVGANATTLTPTSTASRTLTLPDKSGTLATLDDISGGSSGYLVQSAFTSPYNYIGRAPIGTSTSSVGWDIARIEIGSDGSTTTLNSTGAWTNRASLSYT